MDNVYTLNVSIETPKGRIVGASRKVPDEHVNSYLLGTLLERELDRMTHDVAEAARKDTNG